MRLKQALRFILLISCVLVLCSNTAYAYIDPATTSYIIQIVAGLFISLGVLAGTLSAKIRVFFLNLRINLMKRKIAREAARERKRNKNAQIAAAPAYPQSAGIALPVSKGAFLITDDRTFLQRLKLSAPVVGCFTFTFVLFGIFDLYVGNYKLFPFALKDIWLNVLLLALFVYLLIQIVFFLLKGRIFDILLSLLFGFLIAGYIQGNFLNLDFGQLTGDAISWQSYTTHALVNLAIWAGIAALPIVLRYFSRRVWKAVLTFLSVLLIGMQGVGLLSTISGSNVLSGASQTGKYLSQKGMYELSSNHNLIVIVLDRLDQRYIEEMLATDPTFYDRLDGFIQYTDYTSYYCRTFPSGVNLLTGALSMYDTPADRFFEKAWKQSSFLPDLRKAGYTTKLYMDRPYMYTKIEQISHVADNVVDGRIKIKTMPMLKKFLKLSAFRYAPHALKPSFYVSTVEFGQVVDVNREFPPHVTDDAAFYQRLQATGLSLKEDKKNFVYYHLNGMHDQILDENARRLPKGERGSIVMQMKACFKIVYDFLDQMKALGVYEDSTIIILGDHGKSMDKTNLDYAVRTGLFVKPKGAAGTPLVRSDAPVSQEQFCSTIIEQAGLDNSKYGATFFDIPKNADVVRRFYYRVDRPNRRYLEEFEIRGSAKDFNNWVKLREINIKYVHG